MVTLDVCSCWKFGQIIISNKSYAKREQFISTNCVAEKSKASLDGHLHLDGGMRLVSLNCEVTEFKRINVILFWIDEQLGKCLGCSCQLFSDNSKLQISN